MEDFVNEVVVGARGKAIEQLGNQSKDPFSGLPDELIINNILDKIWEAKSLYRCSLVSKRFCSLVYKAKNVSIKIPIETQHENSPSATQPRLLGYPGKPVHSIAIPVGFFPILDQVLKSDSSDLFTESFDLEFLSNITTKFLGKFTSMESVYVEFEYSESRDWHHCDFLEKETLVKWKFDKKSSRFIFVICPRRVIDDAIIPSYVLEAGMLQSLFNSNLAIGYAIFSLMENFFCFLPKSLVRMVITDSKKRGKLDLGESDFVQMRDRHFGHVADDGKTYAFLNSPVLDVPIYQSESLVVMRNFYLGKEKSMDREDGYHDVDDLVVKRAFQIEEESFVEALVEIFKEIRCQSQITQETFF